MRSPGWIKRFDWWHELTLLILLIGLMAMAGALMPRFVNVRSQLSLSKQLWEMAILALPMTLIIITGGIDLSVGSTMGLCAVAFGIAFQQTESVVVSSVLCILVGAVCGGNILGTVLGLLLIHETRLFVRGYWQVDELRSIVIGFLLIFSVLVYRLISSERE